MSQRKQKLMKRKQREKVVYYQIGSGGHTPQLTRRKKVGMEEKESKQFKKTFFFLKGMYDESGGK